MEGRAADHIIADRTSEKIWHHWMLKTHRVFSNRVPSPVASGESGAKAAGSCLRAAHHRPWVGIPGCTLFIPIE